MSTLRVSGLRLLCVAAVASVAAACATTKAPQSAPPPPPPAAKVTDVSGTWELNVESPMGSRASDAIFTQTGETLGGKMVSPRGEVPLTGTVSGDTVKFGINDANRVYRIVASGPGTLGAVSGPIDVGPGTAGSMTRDCHPPS